MEPRYKGRVVFLHGIRTPRKNRDIHRLAQAFRREGFYCIIPYYGYFPAILAGIVRWFDRRLADTLAAFINDDDILVGYSNGATLAYMISKRVKLRGAILINAALRPELAPRAHWVHVYYNEGDLATRIAQYMPFHLWGKMGAIGYTGDQNHVAIIDQGHPPIGLPPLDGHVDVFRAGHLSPWAKYMALRAVEEVQAEGTLL